MKEDEKWIKAFKDKLEDYSEPMPTSGWERLERELMPVTENEYIRIAGGRLLRQLWYWW